MTVPLFALTVPNAQAFLLAHIAPLGPCGTTRVEGDEPIFRQVNNIDGTDDLYTYSTRAILSVHTFGPTETVATREAEITHRRILLIDEQCDVTMVDGSIVNAYYLDVQQRPVLRDYKADNVFRLKAIYEIGLDFS
ncbi:hypothetical protein M2272_005853 [Mycobacterium frederiksbergense]|uniref:DUF3168 domain-containing protein n=1 Tax=Mycolicibacterium frederiksbergense TaxID=117567 RepID=A0ABT6L8E9_9MYCO|nr:hypothetical protein [Mycolicibacterium frederiksbergense]MDH6199185.1 hypothetical protein [Mycolicibacterium frederiksbergense]